MRLTFLAREYNVTISMHSASVPVFRQMLDSLAALLAKAEAHAAERKFEPAIKKNDLAVLKLAHHVNFTSTLYPACLAARNVGWDETNNTLLTVGW